MPLRKNSCSKGKLFFDAESDARQHIDRDLRDLENTERKLGMVFDPEAWEDAMPRAIKWKTGLQSPTEQKAKLGKQTQDQRSGFSMVAGMAELKEQLIHDVVGPFIDLKLYREYRVSLPNGILFYGSPGCGKTYIARNLAEELAWFFSIVSHPTLLVLTFTLRHLSCS
jgi:Cdc6-like AAA superfamily ATPase